MKPIHTLWTATTGRPPTVDSRPVRDARAARSLIATLPHLQRHQSLIVKRNRALASRSAGRRGDPVWCVSFTSVFLHGLVDSLPADDPWRHLRFFIPGGPELNPPESVEGAWGESGREFGTAFDVTDLAIPGQTEHPEVDFVTAGSLMLVPGWFTPRAGALLGAAGVSWRTTFQAICAQLALRSSRDVFADVERAVSAALYRRRTYLGVGDETMPVHLFTSQRYADRVAARLSRDDLLAGHVEEATAAVEAFDEFHFGGSVVSPAAYSKLRIDFSDWDTDEN